MLDMLQETICKGNLSLSSLLPHACDHFDTASDKDVGDFISLPLFGIL